MWNENENENEKSGPITLEIWIKPFNTNKTLPENVWTMNIMERIGLKL